MEKKLIFHRYEDGDYTCYKFAGRVRRAHPESIACNLFTVRMAHPTMIR